MLSFGNETIRVTPDGDVPLKLPAPLADLANSKHGRYILASKVAFAHRGQEWRERIDTNRAVAYRVHLDAERGRWYLTASWTRPIVQTIPLATARAQGMVGVDANADHFAAYLLDTHGNPVGDPRRFPFDLSGSAGHRDAQIRHAITRLLHWTKQTGARAIGIENLDFTAEKTREKHGRKKHFRQLISGMPTGKLKARIVSMAAEHGLAIVAVDPAYTSIWGDQYWRKPLTGNTRTMTRHDAASVAIGRRALGHPIRRRTAPPHDDRSDHRGHRTIQAGPDARGREEARHPVTERPHDARGRTDTQRTRGTSASNTVRDARSSRTWVQDPCPAHCSGTVLMRWATSASTQPPAPTNPVRGRYDGWIFWGGALRRVREGGRYAQPDLTIARPTVRMPGGSGTLHGIDMKFSDIKVETAGDRGTLRVDITTPKGTQDDVAFATLDLAKAPYAAKDDVVVLDKAPAAFTAAGAATFANDTTGSMYQEGDAIDPVTVALALTDGATLPGGTGGSGTGGTGGTSGTGTGTTGSGTVGSGTAGGTGSLAATGSDVPTGALLGAAGAVVVAGAGVVLATRRRHTATDAQA